MTLVNADTGEADRSTAEEARARADQIRTAGEVMWHLVTEAYNRLDYLALGYSSWDDYMTREFGQMRLRLPREEREEVVGSLRAAGLSIRAIAAATSTSVNTVQKDLAAQVSQIDTPGGPQPLSDPEPVQVTPRFKPGTPLPQEEAPTVQGTDGKTYKAKTPAAPKPKSRRHALHRIDATKTVTKACQALIGISQGLNALPDEITLTAEEAGDAIADLSKAKTAITTTINKIKKGTPS
jgi:hypothetical protein